MDLAYLAGKSDPLSADDLSRATFELPWAGRLFGLTLAATEGGLFTLPEFQQAMIASVGRFEAAGGTIDGEQVYYERWVEALVELLRSRALLTDDALSAAEEAVRCAIPAHDHHHDEPPPSAEPLACFPGAGGRE